MSIWGLRSRRTRRVRSGGRELDLEARAADEELVARFERLASLHAHEDAAPRAEIGQHEGLRLLLEDAVVLGDERVVLQDEVVRVLDAGSDLQQAFARHRARAGGAPLEDLLHAERR